MNPRIVNVVICYANENEVLQYAKNLSTQSICKDICLVVSVNKEGELGTDWLKEALDKLKIKSHVIKMKENVGYLNGMLAGYEAVKEEFTECEWFVFSNTDISIESNAFFESFVEKSYHYGKDIWMVGPAVYATASQKHMNPYMINRPSKYYYYKLILGFHFPYLLDRLYSLKNKLVEKKDKQHLTKNGQIYAIHGSYMFLKRDLIEELMKKDAWEVLYDEEPYLAEVSRQFGKKVFYEGSIEVLHVEGATTGKVDLKKRYALMCVAAKRILKEFY